MSLNFYVVFSPALAKAKLGYSHHCHKSVCMYVCVSGCPRSPFSPKLLDQILPKLTGGCSRTSRCALLQMILIWLALWPQKSNRQDNLWVNPHVGTGMDGWAASWNSRPVSGSGDPEVNLSARHCPDAKNLSPAVATKQYMEDLILNI